MFNKKGFTLVELMIVVAIIGILAAIAIPNFVEMQLRAKRAEVPANVDGIKTAEMAYDAAFDTLVAVAVTGSSTLGKQQELWPTPAPGFDTIGWRPDGKVRGQYEVALNGLNDFTITGTCDVDDDGSNSEWTSTAAINATMISDADLY